MAYLKLVCIFVIVALVSPIRPHPSGFHKKSSSASSSENANKSSMEMSESFEGIAAHHSKSSKSSSESSSSSQMSSSSEEASQQIQYQQEGKIQPAIISRTYIRYDLQPTPINAVQSDENSKQNSKISNASSHSSTAGIKSILSAAATSEAEAFANSVLSKSHGSVNSINPQNKNSLESKNGLTSFQNQADTTLKSSSSSNLSKEALAESQAFVNSIGNFQGLVSVKPTSKLPSQSISSSHHLGIDQSALTESKPFTNFAESQPNSGLQLSQAALTESQAFANSALQSVSSVDLQALIRSKLPQTPNISHVALPESLTPLNSALQTGNIDLQPATITRQNLSQAALSESQAFANTVLQAGGVGQAGAASGSLANIGGLTQSGAVAGATSLVGSEASLAAGQSEATGRGLGGANNFGQLGGFSQANSVAQANTITSNQGLFGGLNQATSGAGANAIADTDSQAGSSENLNQVNSGVGTQANAISGNQGGLFGSLNQAGGQAYSGVNSGIGGINQAGAGAIAIFPATNQGLFSGQNSHAAANAQSQSQTGSFGGQQWGNGWNGANAFAQAGAFGSSQGQPLFGGSSRAFASGSTVSHIRKRSPQFGISGASAASHSHSIALGPLQISSSHSHAGSKGFGFGR